MPGGGKMMQFFPDCKQIVNFSFPVFVVPMVCGILNGQREVNFVKTWTRIAAIAMLLTALLVWTFPAVSQADDQPLRLAALNIGKADCLLLMWEDSAFLIDAGYEQTYPALETMLEQYHISRLNGVFLTHCHKDHQGGLMQLAQSGVTIDAWYAPRIFYDTKPAKHPAVLAAALRGQEVTWLDAGDQIPAGPAGLFTVLGPLTVNTDNENNNSLVMRFACPQGSILFAGDMKEDEEADLLAAQAFSPCDVLKVGHHGDNKATGLNMLRIVQPKAALILTSSQEEFDTPARSTLSRLAAVGSHVYVSQDYHDAILLTLTGGRVEMEDVRWTDVPERAEGLSLSIDLAQDTLTILNQGDQAWDMRGCRLYSSKGDEIMLLPDAIAAPGEKFVVGSGESTVPLDALWQKSRVWHQKKLDICVLYDAYGRPLARTDNGLTE